jgi:4'-phosphopantetheinyl transferase
VWFAAPEELGQGSLEEIRAWLSPDEQVRYSRFRRIEDRRRYLAGRAMIRGVLASYLHVDPKSLRFAQNDLGRPELERQGADPYLSFNLSNTSGMVVCCVVRGHEVGVDVEDLRREIDVIPLATRFFAAAEARDVLAQPEHARRRRFFEYWTLKEAYVKALGTGLTVPLNQFWFRLDRRPARVAFELPPPDGSDSWQFEHIEPTEQHLIAVAIQGVGPTRLRLVLRRWRP